MKACAFFKIIRNLYSKKFGLLRWCQARGRVYGNTQQIEKSADDANRIRKAMGIFLCCGFFITAVSSYAQMVQKTQKDHFHLKSVKVLSIVEHPALNLIREGVLDTLKAHSYQIDKNLKWEYQSAHGNMGTAAQIARQFVGAQPDVIVAIATPAAQAVAAANKTIPLVYSAVTDPIAAQLAKNWDASGGLITGVSDKLPLEAQMQLIRKMMPQAKRIGIIYSPGEVNSASVEGSLEKLLPQLGLTLVTAPIQRTVDIAQAVQSLQGKVDVIYTGTDNNVSSAFEALVKAANTLKIPVMASDTENVKRGAAFGLSIDYYELGKITGAVVVAILRGEVPGKISVQTSTHFIFSVNRNAAKAQGLIVDAEILKIADKVY